MPATTYAPALLGFDGQLIEIECDVTAGLPAFVVVGLGDKAIDEARERVRSALKNSGLTVPPKRITLNLAPADLPKDGTGYDLAIAVAILQATGQIDGDLSGSLFHGELSLEGNLRGVRGALMAAQVASRNGFKRIYVACDNAAEACLEDTIEVIPVPNLTALYRHLIGEAPLESATAQPTVAQRTKSRASFETIYGQDMAKRALVVATAGGHNLLLSGPPGAGKTLLAKAALGLMPPLSKHELLEVIKLRGLSTRTGKLETGRPFRSPHHTASSVALIGGGSSVRPGEISLSHRGILFLDELPEFDRNVLEALRQPLEDGEVTVARASGTVTYPARFMLIATQNPCPCGYAGDKLKPCSCSASQLAHYSRRLSGPLLDRMDLRVDVERVTAEELTGRRTSSDKTDWAKVIGETRLIQAKRYHNRSISLNSEMTNDDLATYAALDETTEQLARAAIQQLELSARSYMRVLKVARTIADLAKSERIETIHFTEALQYRARK